LSEQCYSSPSQYPLIPSIQNTITNPKYLVESEASKDWCRGGECTRKQNIETK
jgi:hypothetical protein